MKTYRFAHRNTGVFNGQILTTNSPDALQLNTPADHVPYEDECDMWSQRLDAATGQLLDHQPPAPSPEHEWNAERKRWQLNAAAQAHRERLERTQAEINRILQEEQPHVIRELLLGSDGAKAELQEIDRRIQLLRAEVE